MKSQFDSIVKIKKQELDLAQMTLLNARHRLKALEDKVKAAFDEILSMEIPKKGTFAQIQQAKQVLDMARAKKAMIDAEIETTKKDIDGFQRMYEIAHQELEKMTYLKEMDLEKQLEVLKKKEQRDLDEISLQLFARKN